MKNKITEKFSISISRFKILQLEKNTAKYGISHWGLGNPKNGIVHVVGPENGITLPGMTIVCGDSHTSTHGAFGAIAFGIGTSEVEMVLSSQCIMQPKPKKMRIKGEETRFLDVGGPEYFVYAPDSGVFEPVVELGDQVSQEITVDRATNSTSAVSWPSCKPVTTKFLMSKPSHLAPTSNSTLLGLTSSCQVCFKYASFSKTKAV